MFIALLSGAAVPATGQRAVQAVTTACSDCKISLRRTGGFGGTSSERSLPGHVRAFDVDALGRLWVSFFIPQPPMIFDSTGRYMRDAGRQGSGPGEIGIDSYAVRASGDSMLVLDFANARVNTYSPSGVFIRSFVANYGVEANSYVPLQNGAVVVTGALRSRDQAGFPLHVFDASGTWKRSFGADAPAMAGAGAGVPRLVAAPSIADRFWTIDPLTYVITLWTGAGDRLMVISRKVPWFTPSPIAVNPTPDAIPQTLASVIHEDRGLLWVAAHVPDRRWKASFGQPRPVRGPPIAAQGRMTTPVEDMRKLYDTYIEVYETQSGRLLASHLADDVIVGVLHGGLLIGAEGDGSEFAIYRAGFSPIKR
ncbi:MAG TPA: 6-bladed beta-propeller [Gemmatimonadaceae bacterium]|nr:6-bladed beta-propeller [Gemmatimonadaceae bacterium]